MARKEKSPPEDGSPTFEEALARLECIVNDLEEGEIDLAKSLASYEEGVNLLRKCYHLLAGAERKIELLSAIDAAGEPQTEPFDDESTLSLEEKQGGATRRRAASRRTKKPAQAASQDETMDEKPGLF